MIDTPQALAALVERALANDCVALDTEFVWNRTYYPRLGVIQLALDGDEHHILAVVLMPHNAEVHLVRAADIGENAPFQAKDDVVR